MCLSWNKRWPWEHWWHYHPRVAEEYNYKVYLLFQGGREWVGCIISSMGAKNLNDPNFRTYEMAKLTGADIASKEQNLGYFHSAIFKKSSDLQVLASCVTFASQVSVPPGSLYNVSMLLLVLMLCISDKAWSSDWNILEHNWCWPRPDLCVQWQPGMSIYQPTFNHNQSQCNL